MNLFSLFNRPAPDGANAAKTGFPRFWEVLNRDFGRFFRAGLLALLGSVPFLAGVSFAVTAHALTLALLFGLVGGMLAGPELCGMADTVLRSLRDEPCFWWHTYRRAWKRNAAASLVPGAVGGALLGTQLYLLAHGEQLEIRVPTQVALLGGILLLIGLSTYVWPQLALMELPFGTVVKNAVLLLLGQLPRSLAALAVQAVYWGVVAENLETLLPILPFTSFWLPMVPALYLIYPGLAQGFQIEQRLARRDTNGAEQAEPS